jgi:thiamine-monophosphate kinase
MNMPRKKTGELELIEYIRKQFPRRRREILKGIGDDAAVFRNGFVVSSDSFVEGVHFDLDYFDCFELGFRTMGASLSDLAAMAAEPVCALVSLYLPRGIQKKSIRELYRGFKSLADRFRFDISGGDIVESPYWGLTLTVIGFTRKPMLRGAARPGDKLYLTNYPGLSEAGRIVLQKKYPRDRFKNSIRRHLFPVPRVIEARILRKYAHAGIDTSDGLSTDAGHLAKESKVGIVINAAALPIHPELKRLMKYHGIDPLRFMLASGEDFELLIAAPMIPVIKGLKITEIGRIIEGKGLWLDRGGRLSAMKPTGYEHLK